MNENLQEVLIGLVEKSIQAVEKGAGFLSEEIPDVVHQLLLWEATASFISFLTGIVLLGCLVYFNIKQVKFWNKEVKDKRGVNVVKRIYSDAGPLVLLNVFQIAPLILATHLISLTWLKILIAPKLFILQYSLQLIK